MKLTIIEGQSINWNGDCLSFIGHGRIDDDGSGSSHGDKYHQGDTSLHKDGKPLNADIDHYAVIPEQLIKMVGPTVLGCQGYATYKGIKYPFVTGDAGPKSREGEISIALAQTMCINSDANIGGDNNEDILFEIYPGVPAVVGDIQYQLQHS